MFKDLIEIKTDNHFIVDMMYASLKNNMTGVAVYEEIGFGNRAFVHKDLWEKLKKTIPYLDCFACGYFHITISLTFKHGSFYQ